MVWFLIAVAVVGIVFVALIAGRPIVCLRRKDCCGKGCGCLFPRPTGSKA